MMSRQNDWIFFAGNFLRLFFRDGVDDVAVNFDQTLHMNKS